jgi:PAS domain S-box-containing protein
VSAAPRTLLHKLGRDPLACAKLHPLRIAFADRSNARCYNGRQGTLRVRPPETRAVQPDITNRDRGLDDFGGPLARRLLGLLPVAVYTCDGEGRITFYNQQAASLWGREPRIGDSDERFCGSFRLWRPDGTLLPHDQTPMAEAVRDGRATRNQDAVIERPDGSRIRVLISVDPILDDGGRVTGAINAFHDTGACVAVDAAVRRLEGVDRSRLAAIVESSDDAIISIDMDGVITSWNRGAERLYGYSAGEVVGRPVALLIPEDHIDDSPVIMERLRRGERIEHYETVRIARDGRRIDVSLTVSPIRNAEGTIVGASKIARDISERKRLIEQLREQDRLKDEFLATLAHELRNPLAPIRTGVQLIRRAGHNPALLEKACPMMERQLEQMVRLIDDLLDVSRISRDKLELRREWVELSAVVQSAVETSRPLIEAASHTLTVSLPEEPVLLDADAVRLAQAFSNLLNNAAKYTERGGHIWLTAESNGSAGEAVVRVRDSGIGIPADRLPHIFEMFVQLDRSDRSQGGLGIGLTLAQRLIQLHGGSISVASEGPGTGSEFTVRLPVVVVPETTDSEDPGVGTGDMPARVRRRILVADDNRDSAEMLATALELQGHDVATAHDGHEAVGLVEAFKPDVAFLDLGMPKLDGYAAARRIREEPWGRSVVLVAVTGWGQDEDKRRSQEAGFDAHLVKPVDVADIDKLLGNLSDGLTLDVI